jgi:SAM-dependent methyltransferase
VDISLAMLARLRNKLSAFPEEQRARIRLYEADMMTFALPQQYGLILVGYNSLQYLGGAAAISRLIQRVRDALAPRGTFLVMTHHRNPDWYEGGRTRTVSKEPIVHPVDD